MAKRNKQKIKKNTGSYRADGFVNSVIGHNNKNRDPMANFSFMSAPPMSDGLLLSMFMYSALAKKIVSSPADEATKHWIEIKADKDKCIETALDMLGAEELFANAVRWSRLYGGSGILMLINDGGTFEDPLDEGDIQEIEQLRVYDKTQIWWNDAVLYDDPMNCKYGEPEYYQINPIGGMPFMVHETRLLKFTGDPIPDIQRVANQGWGMPALEGLWNEILNNTHSHKLAILIMERMGQAVLQLSGLLEILDQGVEGEQMVKKRLDVIDQARSVLNTIAIDTDDKFSIQNLSVSGIPDLIDRFGFALSAACNIPFVILFGHNPKGSGLSQSGGTDLENWYNYVGQIQKRQIKKPLYRLIKLLMLSKKGPFKGKELEKWCIDFKPLWSPSELEQAQAKDADASSNFKNAQADSLMITNKVLSRAEIQRKHGYSAEDIAKIDGEIDKEAEDNMGDTLGHSFADVTDPKKPNDHKTPTEVA